MIHVRVVLDTNVVVSALLKPESLPRTVVRLVMTKPARWYVSDAILAEYAEVLARRELNIRKTLRRQFLHLLKKRTHIVKPAHLPPLTRDPDDNKFIECADSARADFLITGDTRHFPPYWKNAKVISPREVLALVAPHRL